MAELAARRRLVTLDDALDALARPDLPPDDPVVVTFDDGTADFADVALPIMVRHQVPVTLFVATDFVERQQSFPNDGAPLSWAALRDGLATGLLTVGSHTHTHALLDRLDERGAEIELDRSLDLIDERLGVRATHFAYPKARLGSPTAERAVRSRFRSAALGGTGPNRYGHTDPYRLTRSPVQVSDGLRWFRHKVEGGMAAEGALRRALDLAAPEGYRRAFVEGGTPVRQLLADHLHWDDTHHPLVGALLERLRSAEPAGPAALVVPLSEREQVVLRYLSSRLSAGEIADELYVSLNTVKTHIKSIYRKLDTNRRWDAVKRARQLQLL